MRKIIILLLLTIILSGCAAYKFQKPDPSPTQGFLAYYDGKPIAEYTVGKDKSLPDLVLAKERFKRRRLKVEYYYKQMHQIESRFQELFWEPPVMIAGFIGGVLRWPFIAVADYKYYHNAKYKAKVDRIDEEKEALDTARVNNLRKELAAYINQDLVNESLPRDSGQPARSAPKKQRKRLPIAPEPLSVKSSLEPAPKTEVPAVDLETAVIAPAIAPVEREEPATAPLEKIKTVTKPETLAVRPALEPPVAVIVARPLKGYSPLQVKFSGQKSYSKAGKIVAYLWDFGDGDTSTQKNPENTYWSTTFGARSFTVTLSVTDQTGSVSSTTSIIEVSTR